MENFNYITIFQKKKRRDPPQTWPRAVYPESTVPGVLSRDLFSDIIEFKRKGGALNPGGYEIVPTISEPLALQHISRNLRTVLPDVNVLKRIYNFLLEEADQIVSWNRSQTPSWGRGLFGRDKYPRFESDWRYRLNVQEMLARSRQIVTDMLRFSPGGEEYYKLEASFKANQAIQKSKRLMKYTPPQPYKPPPSPKPPPSLSNLTALFKNLKLTDLEPRRGTKRRGVLTFRPRKK